MSSTRQLAAILFSDIVGYTALMGKDSENALGLVRTAMSIQKPLVVKYNGKWLKEMGDGAMAQFGSALDAVKCAIQIQRTCRADFGGQLRIGIHLGDITFENGDVYGDGVNVASRLESIADPGGILISESVEKSIQGLSELEAVFVDEVNLKNVHYPLKVYAIQGIGLPIPNQRNLIDSRYENQPIRSKLLVSIIYYLVPALALVIGGFLFAKSLSYNPDAVGITYAQLQIVLPEDMYVATNTDYPALAVSPDGKMLVFTAVKNGLQQLFSRRFDDPNIEPIAGTEEGLAPFFSEDGIWIGFFQESRIMKVRATGGAPIPVHFSSPKGVHRGATWYTNDSLIFAGSPNDGLNVGSAGGDRLHSFGEWKGLLKEHIPQCWPKILPGSKKVLYTQFSPENSGGPDIYIMTLSDKSVKKLVNGGQFAQYSNGFLFFSWENSINALPYDLEKNLNAEGEIILIKEIMSHVNGSAQYAVGGSTLVYLDKEKISELEYLAWVDFSGKVDTIFTNNNPFLNPRFAPDHQSLAITNYQKSNQDIWLFNLNKNQFIARITTHPGEDFDPVWNPNGKEMAIATEVAEDDGEKGPGIGLLRIGTDQQPRRLFKTPDLGHWEFPTSWSLDGNWLLYSCTKGEPIYDIEAYDFTQKRRIPVVNEKGVDEVGAVFSPDGTWIAYVSDFSGSKEVYIRKFPGSDPPRPVSTAGGFEPLWSHDGKKVFYREKNKMMEVKVLNPKTMELGKPEELFQGNFKRNYEGGERANFELSADGTKFLMIFRANMPKPNVIQVVLNWEELLQE